MKFMHIMLRIKDLDSSLGFYVDILGFKEISRISNSRERLTRIMLAFGDVSYSCIELVYYWEPDNYQAGSNIGYISLEVDNIYDTCSFLQQHQIKLYQPPRDGKTALICSPDNVVIQLIQAGEPLEITEPWYELSNIPLPRSA